MAKAHPIWNSDPKTGIPTSAPTPLVVAKVNDATDAMPANWIVRFQQHNKGCEERKSSRQPFWRKLTKDVEKHAGAVTQSARIQDSGIRPQFRALRVHLTLLPSSPAGSGVAYAQN